ncbi:YwhD family protein, partial [Bacillus pumilus]
SMKRRIIVDKMDDSSKRVLAEFLQKHDQGLWDRSSDELKTGLLPEEK